jgi:hypothetical protein
MGTTRLPLLSAWLAANIRRSAALIAAPSGFMAHLPAVYGRLSAAQRHGVSDQPVPIAAEVAHPNLQLWRDRDPAVDLPVCSSAAAHLRRTLGRKRMIPVRPLAESREASEGRPD